MKRMGGWLSGKAPLQGSASSRSLTALDEPAALRDALAAASHIMNDDVERAEIELSKGTSPFHKLGRAMTFFLRATLGFEKEIMEQATRNLAEAEESALDHHKRAQRDPSTAHQSAIYPVGSEYALCHAETQLMSAVVGVLNESLTESLRGFYKLRRAFQTLYEISEAERKYLEKRGKSASAGASKTSLAASTAGETVPASEGSGVLILVEKAPAKNDDEDEDLDFVDADEALPDQPTPLEYQGHLESPDLSKLDIKDDPSKANGNPPAYEQTAASALPSAGAATQADNDVDFRTITTDEIDLFIHSGTALCYGLLQLMLSMIPPAFARLLSLFSFRGDRTNGLRLLWSATKFKTDINGAFASLITLGFHNGAIAFCDILAPDALPRDHLRALLREMRSYYPESKLWLLEEARMLSAAHELQAAVDITTTSTPSPLKQVEGLRVFERSLNLMYLHSYAECAASFIKCVGLNNWSHGLYYYIAASCHVELYRAAKRPHKSAAGFAELNEQKAAEHAHKATHLFETVPQHTGKKRFMARQLPFDVFITRKLAKWRARAAAAGGIPLIDAIGTSPLEEMIYFWAGYKRMARPQLHDSMRALSWSEGQGAEERDERATREVLAATCTRFLGQPKEAGEQLERSGLLSTDMATVRAESGSAGGQHADAWPVAVAHYEMAVCYWDMANAEGGIGQEERLRLLKLCSEELGKVERAESYELEARVGLKITTARETLRQAGVS